MRFHRLARRKSEPFSLENRSPATREKFPGLVAATCIAGLLTACSDGSDIVASASPCNGTEAATSRLLLQQLTDSGVIIKWRGEATAACIGTSPGNMTIRVAATGTDGDHSEAVFSGLDPETTY